MISCRRCPGHASSLASTTRRGVAALVCAVDVQDKRLYFLGAPRRPYVNFPHLVRAAEHASARHEGAVDHAANSDHGQAAVLQLACVWIKYHEDAIDATQ